MNDGGDCRTAPATPGLLKNTQIVVHTITGNFASIHLKKAVFGENLSGLVSLGNKRLDPML